MWRLLEVRKYQFSVVVAAVMSLAACGGGAGGDAGSASSGPDIQAAGLGPVPGDALAQSQSVQSTTPPETNAATAVTSAQAESILVSPINGGAGVSTSPALFKTDGQPVKTLEELPEGISNSAWMKKTTGRLPLRVVLANGTYFLSAPWAWTPSQSGRADSPITVEAQTAGGVVISGAKVVTVTKATHAGAAKVTANFASAGISSFDQLWVNGERAVRARAPNLGTFYYVKKQVSAFNGSSTYDGDPVNTQVFAADPASISYMSNLTAAQKASAVLVAVQSWTTSHHRIQETNTNSEVRVSPAAKWPFLYSKFGFAQRYFVENVPSALDAPSEWYLEPSTALLSYLPTQAQKSADIVFYAPRVRQLLQLTGQASAGKWVEHLNFKGIKFQYAHAPLPAEGWADGHGGATIEAAIEMDGVRNASLSDCEISRVGGYGVWMRTNVRYVSVTGCEIFDAGAGGVKIGTRTLSTGNDSTNYNTVKDNRIHGIGFQFPGGVGVWIGQSAYNTVSDNLIGDTTYTGVSVGATAGYDTSTAHHNIVARNFLYNVIQGSLSDGGAIYTLGISPGTEIKGNVIKNVHGFNQYGAGAWGMYNDEGSSNILMDSNIVVDTDNGGYLMHYGQYNTVSNNVLAQGEHSEVQVTKAELVKQVSFDRNYLIPTMSDFITYGTKPAPLTSFAGNVISAQFVPSITSPAECGTGCSVSGGVVLRNGALLDVPSITKGGSNLVLPAPVAANWSSAPLTSVQSPKGWWGSTAASVPSRNFEFDAATADFGSAPNGMVVQPVSRPELVSVIRASSGEKCLGFQDGGNLANHWEPFSFVDTNFDAGATTVTFTLKVDAATEFVHEWRDYRGTPFKTGPRVLFSGSRGVMVANQKVANLPVGQWITVTVASRQGANQNWGMQIKYADNSVSLIQNLAPYTPTWASTKAVFFISDATTTSTPCIGRLSIVNQ